MSHEERILAQVGDIQPLPGTILKLINVVNDPGSTVNDIIEAIRYDQALTAQMLRLCNSAYFGLSREVHSLNEAIRYLGTMKMLQLAMAVHGNSLLSKRQSGYGLEPGILWRHSVAVALTTAVLAQRINYHDNGLVFTAALVHDIGKVILNDYVADEFAEIVRLVSDGRTTFLAAEKQVLGFSHDEIGAKVAEMWQLPDSLVRCIRYHHNPDALDPADILVDTVYLANCICLLLGIGLGSDGLSYRANPQILDRYGLCEADLELAGAETLVELKRVEQVFADTSGTQAEKEPVAT